MKQDHVQINGVDLDSNINWCPKHLEKVSPNPLWTHQFMSLKWLKLFEPSFILTHLNHFIDELKKRKSYNYYFANDHASCERLRFFGHVLESIKPSPDFNIDEFNRLIQKHLEKLSTVLYATRHNHGMMTDLALLEFVSKHESFDPHNHYFKVARKRFNCQLDWLWAPDGGTREHSLSYQEFNLFVLLKFLDISHPKQEHNLIETKEKIKKIIQKAQTLLYYALQDNGRLFPLGDSFNSQPKIFLYKKLDEKKLLSSQLKQNLADKDYTHKGFLLLKQSGFFVLRDHNFHMIQSACWFSPVHKQEDDLSFCLNLNKSQIFVDPGYSDTFGPCCLKSTSLRAYHNTVCTENEHCLESKKRSLFQKIFAKAKKILGRNHNFKKTRFSYFYHSKKIWAISSQTSRPSLGIHKRTLIMIPSQKIMIIIDRSTSSQTLYQNFHTSPQLKLKRTKEHIIKLVNEDTKQSYYLKTFGCDTTSFTKKAEMWIERNKRTKSTRVGFKFKNSVKTVVSQRQNTKVECNIEHEDKLSQRIKLELQNNPLRLTLKRIS